MTSATSPILLKWDPKSLEIRTLTVERLLEPLVTQVGFTFIMLRTGRRWSVDNGVKNMDAPGRLYAV